MPCTPWSQPVMTWPTPSWTSSGSPRFHPPAKSSPAGRHALHALVPAGDDLAHAELELQRIATVPARVEFLAGRVCDPDVVDLDPVARVRRGPVAFPDIGDLKFGRRLAAGKIDLGPGDAHSCLFL